MTTDMRKLITIVESAHVSGTGMILAEAHADYTAMFRFLTSLERNIDTSVRSKLVDMEVGHRISNILDKATRRANHEIDWARKHLKRYDRVIWWLRFVRVCLVKRMMADLRAINGAVQIMTHYQKFADLIVEPSADQVSPADIEKFYFSRIQRDLEHLYSLPVAKIQEFRPANENPIKVVNRFRAFEKEWQNSRRGLIPFDANDGRILLRFPSGMVWMQLNRAACEQEGDAMGHCGNVPAQQEGETILSLREPVKKGELRFWKPYLTFILDANGLLGEMKGRFNRKPSLAHREGHAPSDFHDEIEALLRLPIIRGIKGGGYAPQQNFSLDDLGAARRDRLVREVPHLARVVRLNFDNKDED